MTQETGFEKARGVSRVEVRLGSAQVQVTGLKEPVMAQRIEVLKAISEAGVSIDFLKLTPDGLSFLIAERMSTTVENALKGAKVCFEVGTGRSVVMIHAVNMRDEEGLIAQVIQRAISLGTRIEHISDMHDRMLLVVLSEDSESLKLGLENALVDTTAGGRR